MFQNHKILKKYEEEESTRRHAIIEEVKDGRSVINIRLPTDESIVSPYSSLHQPALCGELSDYLLESTRKIPIKTHLSIRIENKTTPEQIELFQKALASQCDRSLSALVLEKMRTNNKILFCTLIGFLVLILVFTLSFIEKNNILFESISIVAWVFLWEGTDLFVFEKGRISREQINCHRLKNATIITDDAIVV